MGYLWSSGDNGGDVNTQNIREDLEHFLGGKMMTTNKLARSIAKITGKDVEEVKNNLDRRRRDIDTHDYAYAFEREIKLSGGKINERRR